MVSSQRYPITELDPASWQHQVNGSMPTDVSARLLTNIHDESLMETESPAFIITGYGEGSWAAKRALKFLASIGRGAIIGLVDTSQIPASLTDYYYFCP